MKQTVHARLYCVANNLVDDWPGGGGTGVDGVLLDPSRQRLGLGF